MDQKWIQMLVILVFYQQITPGTAIAKVVKEGESVEIKCKTEKGTLGFWFRVLDQSGMEFIASFSPSGQIKKPGSNFTEKFTYKKQNEDVHVLTLKSYRSSDSGIYSCGSLIGGNSLQFGEVFQLYEEKKKEIITTPPCTTLPTPSTTTTSCVCKEMAWTGVAGTSDVSMFCTPIILGPLAGGCGLLLLCLIITTIYCNKMRTRRCPHHYKRKPRMGVPEKMMTNI
ncbi:T-cell surface glycoprotein CD8 alpha chain [Melanotaenia boesemani]|uniref:T-cell surface glycoprotein CD8 alpha chain n=1 Tax=Melanotaenia boesemani TaxID=1250792 RepID=UPI001C05E8D9|nr:T-cell surface glycoprotein CD8 alpha chain [Melanotaenia boesemani]